MFAELTFSGPVYATQTDLDIQHDTATKPIYRKTGFLAANANSACQFREVITYGLGDTIMLENKKLEISVPTADPTAGNSTVTVFIIYRIVNV